MFNWAKELSVVSGKQSILTWVQRSWEAN